MQEIERKFLVNSLPALELAHTKTYIKQAYLSVDPERTVRIRQTNTSGWITIKGQSTQKGLVRFEWEKQISDEDAQTLFPLCLEYPIEKYRYQFIYEGTLIEVDVFQGLNKGLILAEIELKTTESRFSKPHWLGKEVTGNVRYYNSYLSQNPFSRWL